MSKNKTSVSIRKDVHKRAHLAASLTGVDLLDFAGEALDAKSKPILKKHGVRLPADAVPFSQTA